MKIEEHYVTKNPCYKQSRYITPRGLMLHSVGCSQPNAAVFDHSFNKENMNACVHAFIDANDGIVHQHLPWNMRGWHAGGYANNTHIGVEMCESNCISYDSHYNIHVSDIGKAEKHCEIAYKSAVDLFAYLCKKYNLNPFRNIISHAEGYKLGVASNHGDPEHYWSALRMPYTMGGFRKDVSLKMDTNSLIKGGNTTCQWQ